MVCYSLAAPNGCSKQIIPYENTLESISLEIETT